ncbi:MAG TPA: 5'/3'-nucleotidase SurE [Candidatus Pelethenecus sp.]|nr:5'/3'-nucleotidase SurE [Candidatus Pelethenecus sp.]
MNILVVNDDGVFSEGIKILATKLKRFGNVTVCGPDQGRSASSHSIVLHHTLSFEFIKEEDEVKWYKTSGMPADCTRLCLGLLDTDFDIVLSGVNNGLNLGTDIIYSGTVSAAREAHIEGVPAIAISTDFDCFEIVEKELDSLLAYIFNEKLYSKEYVLNINFPTNQFQISKGYIKNFKTTFVLDKDGQYTNQDCHIVYDTNPETDVYLADQGYITFVPLKVEQTHISALEKLKQI